MLSLGWEGTALALWKTAPPFCFLSFLGAVESKRACQKESRKATEHVRPSWGCRMHSKPQGGEWGSLGSPELARWATAAVRRTGEDPRHVRLLGKTGLWPELTLSYLTAKDVLPSTVNVWMTPLSSLAEDRWIYQRMLISLQVWLWGLSLLFQERVKSHLFLPPGEVLLFKDNKRALTKSSGCVCVSVCLCLCLSVYKRWPRLFFLFIHIKLIFCCLGVHMF